MKLLVCLVVVLCVSESLSEPLLGLRRRKLYNCRGCVKGGILGALLGGGDCGDCNSQQIQTRRTSAAAPAPAPAPAPAASPTVNVNVQNVYTNQNNKQISNDNRIGSVNNNAVNNRYNVNQDINNRAESNVYNNKEVNNRLTNNNYGRYSEPPQQPCEDC